MNIKIIEENDIKSLSDKLYYLNKDKERIENEISEIQEKINKINNENIEKLQRKLF